MRLRKRKEAGLCWAEATKVWEEARHTHTHTHTHIHRWLWLAIWTMYTVKSPQCDPADGRLRLSLATKPDGAAVQRCLELLFFFPKQYVNWDVKQLNKEWEVGDGQGNTQHVTALQAWRRDDVISVLSLFPILLNFYIGPSFIHGGGGAKKIITNSLRSLSA